MKKLSAILLLCTFAFSQYARQLSYLECKFSNLFKATTVKCDCEKKAGFDRQETDPEPVSPHHPHLHLDELFCGSPSVIIQQNFHFVDNISFRLKKEPLCKGNPSPPWQPPNC